MEVDVWMFLEPAIALLMGVEIIEDDVQLAIREGGNHAVHEAEELDTPPPLGMLGNNSTWRLRALQTRSWCRAAGNRGSGRSRRVRYGVAVLNHNVPAVLVEHAFMGPAAGCVIGHHEANGDDFALVAESSLGSCRCFIRKNSGN